MSLKKVAYYRLHLTPSRIRHFDDWWRKTFYLKFSKYCSGDDWDVTLNLLLRRFDQIGKNFMKSKFLLSFRNYDLTEAYLCFTFLTELLFFICLPCTQFYFSSSWLLISTCANIFNNAWKVVEGPGVVRIFKI